MKGVPWRVTKNKVVLGLAFGCEEETRRTVCFQIRFQQIRFQQCSPPAEIGLGQLGDVEAPGAVVFVLRHVHPPDAVASFATASPIPRPRPPEPERPTDVMRFIFCLSTQSLRSLAMSAVKSPTPATCSAPGLIDIVLDTRSCCFGLVRVAIIHVASNDLRHGGALAIAGDSLR